ncbi:MAG TPA: hypothetical protein VM581_00305 [Magnetospirillaceae bacterium]|nr:hypothetical protein [Magnetospirillaceae bacterium]
MNEITRIPLQAKYKRDNGVFVLDANMPLPDSFTLNERSLVHIPAGAIAGNHRHPRQEAFICFQEGVELHWIDSAGEKHSQAMHPTNGEGFLFVISPMVPHAIANKTAGAAMVMEYADGPALAVEQIPVVETL